jgi:tetratricopeptide (TPR) repeat protein
MKPTKSFKILTPVIMALFILSLFSGVVAAQATPKEQYEKANEIYKINKDQYENTRKQFEEAKDIFEKANKQLGKDNKSKEDLLIKAKNYLLKAIDFAQSQLLVMRSRMENSENKGFIPSNAITIIDGHTAQLELLKGKVEKANSTKELIEVHKELKKIVVYINLETRYYLGIVLNQRIDNFIIKADNVSKRLESAIQKREGNDTTKLEKEFADFKDALQKAKDSYNKTKELYKTHNGFADDGTVKKENDAKNFLEKGNKLQRDTIRELRQAGNHVIKFVKDLRQLVVNKGKVDKNDELNVIGGVTTTRTTDRVKTTPTTGGVTTTLTTGGVTTTLTTGGVTRTHIATN